MNGQKSDSQTDNATDGRNPRGRFAKGNQASRGRRTGSVNKTSLDFRRIKELFAGSYERVDGAAIFDRLAREQPAVWCGLVVKCMPREVISDVSISSPFDAKMVALENAGVDVSYQRSFLQECQELAGEGVPVTPDVVKAKLMEDLRSDNGTTHKPTGDR